MKSLFNKVINFGQVLCIVLLSIPFLGLAQQNNLSTKPYRKAVINEGIQVGLAIDHVDNQEQAGFFKEGDDVRFRFSISDTLTKNGLSGAFPAAWMDPIPEVDNECVKKVATFITGSILSQPELNLNVYYVLTLNAEPTITVVDPLFGYGGSQLLALIELNAPGMDWVLSKDQNFVFVSMPDAKQIAVINTSNWKIVTNIDLPAAPYNVDLQSDGQRLWVTCQNDENREKGSGVAVIDLRSNEMEQFIPTGQGAHDLLIRPDDQFVYVTNHRDHTLSVIEVSTLKTLVQIPVCEQPSSMTYSEEAEAVYVISEETGGLSIIDVESHKTRDFVQLEPGICQVKFEPTQRFAFILNTKQDNVSILDASINKVVQVGDLESEPDQINFTETLAYIRHRNSELVLMIPLANIGNEGLPVTVVDFPAGQYPPGEMTMPCLASGMVQAPGESAVLIANAPDKTIYYYSEGMAAPMGNFNNYNQEPRAVMVIDRSIQEVAPGVYETIAKLRSPGEYDIAFFMDVPRFIHCFRVNIHPDPALDKIRSSKRLGALKIDHLPPRRYILVGEEFPINFNLKNHSSDKLRTDLEDVQIMCMSGAGATEFRKNIKPNLEGTYSTNAVFTKPGVYYLYVESQNGGLPLNNPQYRTLHVKSSGSKK